MYDKIARVLAKRHLARITRSGTSEDHDHGFILGLSMKLVLFQNEEDFLLNGYSVVRLDQITALGSGRFERYFERMLREEGLTASVGITDVPDLTSWQTLLADLKRHSRHVIVECEVGDPDNDEFYIGRLERVNRASVVLRHFDALGWWDEAPTRIPYDAITKVRFGERYIEMFSRHVRQR